MFNIIYVLLICLFVVGLKVKKKKSNCCNRLHADKMNTEITQKNLNN